MGTLMWVMSLRALGTESRAGGAWATSNANDKPLITSVKAGAWRRAGA